MSGSGCGEPPKFLCLAVDMAKRCARPGCGHKKTEHTAQSENYDAEQPCDECDCPDFLDEDETEGAGSV